MADDPKLAQTTAQAAGVPPQATDVSPQARDIPVEEPDGFSDNKGVVVGVLVGVGVLAGFFILATDWMKPRVTVPPAAVQAPSDRAPTAPSDRAPDASDRAPAPPAATDRVPELPPVR